MRTPSSAFGAPSRLSHVPRRLWRCAAGASLLLAALDCGATAFFVNQQSVKGLGRVDAGNTTAADELGTLFFNPAGMPLMWDGQPDADDRRSAASFAVNVIQPRSSQTNAGSTIHLAPLPESPYGGGNARNPTNPTPVPNYYFAYRIDRDTAVGVALNFPFGLSARFDRDWYGRYDATEASLRTYNVGLVGARRFGRWSFGAGLDVQYARTTLEQALPNFSATGALLANDGRVFTRGDAYTPGFNVGFIYALDDRGDNRIGAHYRSGMKHRLKGTTDISGIALGNGLYDVHADLDLPAVATVGAQFRVAPSLLAMADVAWYDWSTFDEVRIRFDQGAFPDQVRESHYRDAYGVAAGLEYREGASPLSLRAGIHYDSTPTVDGYRDVTVPDAERLWLGMGATYRASRAFEVDFAFTHVFFRDTQTAVTRPIYYGAAFATIRGSVKTTVDTVAFDMRWRF